MPIDFDAGKITVTKLDVAKRQLDTAIYVWFFEGDPVSVHTLASASHEIIDHLYKKKGFQHLLFEPPEVKRGDRQNWAANLRTHFNFFKHGRYDADKFIEFKPIVNDFLLFFSIKALQDMKLTLSLFQKAFMQWHFINRPEFLVEGAYDQAKIVDMVDELRSMSKQEFLHNFNEAWTSSRIVPQGKT